MFLCTQLSHKSLVTELCTDACMITGISLKDSTVTGNQLSNITILNAISGLENTFKIQDTHMI